MAAAVSDSLVGNAGSPRGKHGVGECAVAGEMEVGEQHLTRAHKRIFRLDRLLDLDNHLGCPIDIGNAGQDGGAGLDVGLIGEAASFAGCVLHIHGMAVSYQFFHTRGRHADAVLVVFDFFWNADNHCGKGI